MTRFKATMISKSLRYILAILVVVAFSTDVYAIGMAKVTVKVLDESGNPVENADVGVGFGENSVRKERAVKGVTKSDGTFSASDACNSFIGFNVKKNGYYCP